MTSATSPPLLQAPEIAPTLAPARSTRAAVRPRLSVIIVNHCQWEETARLVRRFQICESWKSGDAEAVIVDNQSPLHPARARLRRQDGVSVRAWRRNRGFAAAVNEGVRLSRGDWFLVLNADLTLPKGFLDKAVCLADELARASPQPGIVGFQLRNTDGSRQWSCGNFPSLFSTLLGLTRPRAKRKYLTINHCRRSRVPWVTGCCFLLNRRCFEDLGGFDQDFFLYYEDVDLCRRARSRGWQVLLEPSLWAVHHRPLHKRSVSPLVRLFTRHSLLVYAAKYWPAWQGRLLASAIRWEARFKQWWAGWRERPVKRALYRELGQIVELMAEGRFAAARRRLNRVVRRDGARRTGSGGILPPPTAPGSHSYEKRRAAGPA